MPSAVEVPAGCLVVAEIDGVETVCLKAERLGRDYLHHYLVPLELEGDDLRRLTLRYLDPSADAGTPIDAVMVAGESRDGAPEVGDVLVNAAGHFLKVLDTASTQRQFAYVELATGMVRMRQERGVTEVLGWRIKREAE